MSPTEPKQKLGLYWGYQVRFEDYFSKVYRNVPYDKGYQIKILVDQNHGVEFTRELKQEIVEKINKTDST